MRSCWESCSFLQLVNNSTLFHLAFAYSAIPDLDKDAFFSLLFFFILWTFVVKEFALSLHRDFELLNSVRTVRTARLKMSEVT